MSAPGYAIEYDHFDPQSESQPETKSIQGCFAGQINGTTGCRAAAQGLPGGINAALLAQGRMAGAPPGTKRIWGCWSMT